MALFKHGVPYDPKVWAAALGYKLVSTTTT